MENKLKETNMSTPFACEAEEAVICSLLLDHDHWPEITPVLTADMFETPALAFIYGAMKGLYDRGEQPDLVTIEMEMRKLNPAYFTEINGLAAVNAGMRRIRQSGNITAYVHEVKRCYLLRRLRALFMISLSRAGLDESVPEDLISDTEKSLLEFRHHLENGSSLRPLGQVASGTLSYHEERMKGNGGLKQVRTGFPEFDALTGGMHNGELYVLGGRPGDGKSSVALQIAMNATLQEKNVCFFSLEMTDLQIMNRLFAGYASVSPDHLRVSGLTAEEMERIRKLTDDWQQLPFYLDYTPANRIENIRSQVMMQKKKKGCDLVVVDYLHLLEGMTEKGENLVQVIGRHIKALKALAVEADCAVLVLSQMNRSSELRKEKGSIPILSDLRDSGTIEQVADCVFFVYRPDRHGVNQDSSTGKSLKNMLLLMIIKNRNGRIGTARVVHNGSFTRLTGPDGKVSF